MTLLGYVRFRWQIHTKMIWECVSNLSLTANQMFFTVGVQEFMKATVDMADLLGLHLVMSRNAGKGEYKIMVAAMGWATAELVMSR